MLLLSVAVTVTLTLFVTAEVVTVKVALLLPAGTVTDAGTVVDTSLLERLTTNPPVGAFALSLIVPVPVVPPRILSGERSSSLTSTTTGAVTFSACLA